MKCGEAIIATLERYGATTLFGIPGVHTLELYRGIINSSISSVLTRHEQGASFMADGYARAVDKPAICCVISGPGVTNAATGVGQAYSDSVPMFVLASGAHRDHEGLGKGHLHECKEQRLVMEPITAAAVRATSQLELPQILATLWSTMLGPRPRPVYLEVPIDLLDEEVQEPWAFIEPQVTNAAPNADLVAQAAVALSGARSPLLIVGGGARGATAVIDQFARMIDAPVLTTAAGKGVIDERDSRVAGTIMRRAAVRKELSGFDVVVAIGTDLASTETACDQLPIEGTLIRIDIDEDHRDDYPEAIFLAADAATAVEQLTRALSDLPATQPTHSAAEQAARLLNIARADAPAYHGWHRQILDELFREIDQDALIYSDMTQLAYAGTQNVPLSSHSRWNHPSGFGTLGYGLPAAIGGCVAAPEKQVVAIVGDGGIMYTVPELATIAELGLNLTLVVWNNSALGQIRDDMINLGMQAYDVRPTPPDFALLANSMGVRAIVPASLAEIAPAMLDAKKNGPTLVLLNEDTLKASLQVTE